MELRSARRESSGLILATVLFSIVVNALMLTGPLYMLQVYDRVLGSGSEATLVALSALVVGLFLAMGVLEYARGRVMAIVGARFQERLDRRVFVAAMQRSAVTPNDPAAVVGRSSRRWPGRSLHMARWKYLKSVRWCSTPMAGWSPRS